MRGSTRQNTCRAGRVDRISGPAAIEFLTEGTLVRGVDHPPVWPCPGGFLDPPARARGIDAPAGRLNGEARANVRECHSPDESRHPPGRASDPPGGESHFPGRVSHPPGGESHSLGRASHPPGRAGHPPGRASHPPDDLRQNWTRPGRGGRFSGAGGCPPSGEGAPHLRWPPVTHRRSGQPPRPERRRTRPHSRRDWAFSAVALMLILAEECSLRGHSRSRVRAAPVGQDSNGRGGFLVPTRCRIALGISGHG